MRTVRVRMYRRNPSKSRKRRKHTRYGKVRAHKRRVNPARSRKRVVRRRRRNPAGFTKSIRSTFQGATLKRAFGLGVGFLGGLQVMQLVTAGTLLGRPVWTPPALVTGTLRPGMGLVNIILGGFVVTKSRKAMVKDIGTGLVAAGAVDVIRSVVNIAAPGALGMYINESVADFRQSQPLGMQHVNRRTLGRIGTRYGIPSVRDLTVGGYTDSSFSSVDSSFAAG